MFGPYKWPYKYMGLHGVSFHPTYRGHITPPTGFLLGPPCKISHFVHQILLINKMRFLGYRMVIINIANSFEVE